MKLIFIATESLGDHTHDSEPVTHLWTKPCQRLSLIGISRIMSGIVYLQSSGQIHYATTLGMPETQYVV